jgi:hypothetical protein
VDNLHVQPCCAFYMLHAPLLRYGHLMIMTDQVRACEQQWEWRLWLDLCISAHACGALYMLHLPVLACM